MQQNTLPKGVGYEAFNNGYGDSNLRRFCK
jgi:hypothetical protein